MQKEAEEDGTNDVCNCDVKSFSETVHTGAGDFHKVSEAEEIVGIFEIVDDVVEGATVRESANRYVAMTIYNDEETDSDVGGVGEDDF